MSMLTMFVVADEKCSTEAPAYLKHHLIKALFIINHEAFCTISLKPDLIDVGAFHTWPGDFHICIPYIIPQRPLESLTSLVRKF